MSGEGQGGRDDWTPGDLALCVNGEGWAVPGVWLDEPGPSAGQILTVRGVRLFRHRVGLKFDGWGHDWFHAVDFRKITPGADIHGVEEPTRIAVPHLFPAWPAVAERSEAEPFVLPEQSA